MRRSPPTRCRYPTTKFTSKANRAFDPLPERRQLLSDSSQRLCLAAWTVGPRWSGGSCHKYHFCRDKTRLLSRQKHACRDKHNFVATKPVFCRDKSMLVATNTCLSQQNFCRDKHHFVVIAASILFSREKACFVAAPPMIVDSYVVCWTALAGRVRLTQSCFVHKRGYPSYCFLFREVEYSIIRSAES